MHPVLTIVLKICTMNGVVVSLLSLISCAVCSYSARFDVLFVLIHPDFMCFSHFAVCTGTCSSSAYSCHLPFYLHFD